MPGPPLISLVNELGTHYGWAGPRIRLVVVINNLPWNIYEPTSFASEASALTIYHLKFVAFEID